jgi:hypothetical protein
MIDVRTRKVIGTRIHVNLIIYIVYVSSTPIVEKIEISGPSCAWEWCMIIKFELDAGRHAWS